MKLVHVKVDKEEVIEDSRIRQNIYMIGADLRTALFRSLPHSQHVSSEVKSLLTTIPYSLILD